MMYQLQTVVLKENSENSIHEMRNVNKARKRSQGESFSGSVKHLRS